MFLDMIVTAYLNIIPIKIPQTGCENKVFQNKIDITHNQNVRGFPSQKKMSKIVTLDEIPANFWQIFYEGSH